MRLKCFNRLGVIVLAAMTTLAASGQTYTFTQYTGFGPGQFKVNGTGPNPAEYLTAGASVTLNISTTDLLFLTADPNHNTGSENYYAVNPGAFSNSSMASPTASATVIFTPPVSNTTYTNAIYYVDATSGTFGTLNITVYPDTTSTISISRGIVPTNGPATITVIPKNSGNVITTSSSAFTMSVSSGGGSVSSLSPSSGSSFTATYAAGTTAGAYSISDGLGASVPVSVVTSVPLTGFTVTNVAGTQLHLTGKGFSNLTYQVLMSKNLLTWTNLGPATSSVTGLLQFTDTNAPFSSQRYYRLAYP